MILPAIVKTRLQSRAYFIGSRLVAALGMFLLAAGCVTVPDEPAVNEPVPETLELKAPDTQKEHAIIDEQASQVSRLQSEVKELEVQVRKVDARSKAEREARESLTRRLEAAQDAREDAIREVVRVRARMQGMASEAEASASLPKPG